MLAGEVVTMPAFNQAIASVTGNKVAISRVISGDTTSFVGSVRSSIVRRCCVDTVSVTANAPLLFAGIWLDPSIDACVPVVLGADRWIIYTVNDSIFVMTLVANRGLGQIDLSVTIAVYTESEIWIILNVMTYVAAQLLASDVVIVHFRVS